MHLNTYDGVAMTEQVSLGALKLGDIVLGHDTKDGEPRTVHRVTAELGYHRVPAEDLLGRFLDRIFGPGDRPLGILVKTGRDETPGMFVSEDTPVIDRVIGWGVDTFSGW